MRELFKEHTFEAKVNEVHTSFIISWLELVELDNYPGIVFECATRTEYSKDPRKSAQETLYSIVLEVEIYFNDSADDKPLVEKGVAEIKFLQTETDQCEAKLLIETDPEQWFEGGVEIWNLPVDFGKDCIIYCWEHVIEKWNNPPVKDTPQLRDETGLVKREFIFDTTPRNFERILKKCSSPVSNIHSCDWETMEPKEGVELELAGFYAEMPMGGIYGVIKIQISHYSSEQIQVIAEYDAVSNPSTKFFDQLMNELDRLGRLWLKDEAEVVDKTTIDRRSDFQPEEVIELIQNGVFDGCGMDRETAIETVRAILWLAENVDKLTVVAIANKAGYAREHWYNFRKGCIQAGVKKINGIDVITVRKNN